MSKKKSLVSELQLKVGAMVLALLIIALAHFAYSAWTQANKIAADTVVQRATSLSLDIKNRLAEFTFQVAHYSDHRILAELPLNLLYTQYALKEMRDLVYQSPLVKSVMISDGSPYIVEGYPLYTLHWATPSIIEHANSVINESARELMVRKLLISNKELGITDTAGSTLFIAVPLRQTLPSLIDPFRYTSVLFFELDVSQLAIELADYESLSTFSERQMWFSEGQEFEGGLSATHPIYERSDDGLSLTLSLSHQHSAYTREILYAIIRSALLALGVLIILFWYLAYVSRKVTSPMKQLEKYCTSLTSGNYQQNNANLEYEELKTLQKTLNELVSTVNTQVTQLKQEKVRAEQSELAKAQFLATMSHEIRTPMNAILGVFQLLRQHNHAQEERSLVEQGYTSSQTLLALVNDILDFSKMEAGKLNLEVLEVDILQLCREVIQEYHHLARDKQVVLELTSELKPHLSVRLADPLRLKQILRNLLSNAIKFTEQGQVELNVLGDKETLTIEVCDTGIGMTPTQVDSLFKHFHQADSSTTRKYGGSGLGLAIVKQLVELMQGEVAVSSVAGEGSQFRVNLPLLSAKPTPQPVTTEVKPQIPDLRGVNVLLAEDNLINQQIFAAMMKKTHANITLANNGQLAMDCFNESQPDLFFVDIQMPVMDGIEVCQQVKSTEFNKPLIAITANVLSEDVSRYLSLGFDDFVAKPIDMQALFDTVTRVMDKQAQKNPTKSDASTLDSNDQLIRR
ncbi:hybrid sensor histidine kinase/response regulator [Pseudoalteromonas rubra]|uniref:histidine kinase n=1 Tax=Pseudoalteromonas rubra TaxID=43658 RepID=A0A5S3WG84_9GAMM|nr:ATP-binding protein [Pseudoalteromonas rubra]TMP25643.1 hybrid sensor histidine kinase/response regulator [Pseudoalteromonas rubra]TMP27828.1 hybrid sensor histidine kinase/response regulator [Pseudoalteromonas rubra]